MNLLVKSLDLQGKGFWIVAEFEVKLKRIECWVELEMKEVSDKCENLG